MNDTVADKVHADKGPSGAYRWTKCAISPFLERKYPNTSNKAARWGTVAHEVAEKSLVEGKNAEEFVGVTFELEGERVTCDMEMANCVNDYISYVNQYVPTEEGHRLLVEQSVPIDHMTGETGATGTSDVVGLSADGTELTVIDLKTGTGKIVHAATRDEATGTWEPNEQLFMYASGTLAKYRMIFDNVRTVKGVIVQPRWRSGPHISEHTLTVEELAEFEHQISVAAGRCDLAEASVAEGGDPLPWMEAGKHCDFCRAKHGCPKLEGAAFEAATGTAPGVFANLSQPTVAKKLAALGDNVKDAGVEQLVERYKALSLLETFAKAVRAEIERRIFGGETLPGLKLVAGKAPNRAWMDDEAALAALKKRKPLADVTNVSVISPTAAEKLFKEQPKVWKNIAALIAPRTEGKPTIAFEDDPKPAISIATEAGTFANLDAAPATPATDAAPANDPFA